MNKIKDILNTSVLLKDVLFFILFLLCGLIFYTLFLKIDQLNQTIESLQQNIENLNNKTLLLSQSKELMQQELTLKSYRIKELENAPEILKTQNEMKKFVVVFCGIALTVIVVGGVLCYGTQVFSLKFLLPSSMYSFLQNNTFLIKDEVENFEFIDYVNRYVYNLEIKNKKPYLSARDFDSSKFEDSVLFFKYKEDYIKQLSEKLKDLTQNASDPTFGTCKSVSNIIVPLSEKVAESTVNDVTSMNVTNYTEVVEVANAVSNLFGV